MGWERELVRLAGPLEETVAGSVRRAGAVVQATMPWRARIAVGTSVELADGRYIVEALRDPGGRHETLELTLAPAPESASGRRTGRPAERDARLDAIRAEIAALDAADPAHVTGNGRPDANVLSERLGWRVSARERDLAMDRDSNEREDQDDA